MPFTTLKKLSVQTAGTNSGTWGAGGTTGADLNTGVMGPIDTMLAGISTFSVSSSNISLTFTAGGSGDVQNCMWRFTGTLLSSIVVSPTAGDATTYLNGFYYFENLTSGSFTITLTTGTGSVVLPQGRRGCVFIDGTNAPRITGLVGSSTVDPIPAGTVMLFYQNAAPAGWTIVTSQNDKALRVVSSAGGVAGGTNAFSTVFAQTTTGSYGLTLADIPLHGHPFRLVGAGQATSTATGGMMIGAGNGSSIVTTNYSAYTGTPTDTAGQQIGGAGGGGTHSHSLTMSIQYIDIILASRD